MPPKKDAPSKKAQEKQKQKIIEDKTFGLKNKKGKKQQEFVKNVSNQIKGQSNKKLEMEKNKDKEKKIEEEKMKEVRSLFKPVVEKQQVQAGVDPKSVLCVYFKIGACNRGDKCKFSHDLSVEHKSEKKDLYSDNREGQDVDQSELESMIEKKHGKSNKSSSEKVCKFFLDAVEKKMYGWFWVCPNGGDNCQYRHALPPGFVLKRDKEKPTQTDEIPIEDIIEEKRASLEGELTPVNEETFKEWKAMKIKEKRTKHENEMNKKREEMLSGKIVSKISGRDAFVLDPSLICQDDEEADLEEYESETPQESVLSYEEIIANKTAKLKIEDEIVTKAFSLHPQQRFVGNTEA